MVTARRFIDAQLKWCSSLDRLLPREYTVDGNRDFLDNIVPQYVGRGMRVYDVGGGKNPVIDRATKERLGLTIVGLDIDADELAAAPAGIYDEVICADIGGYRGSADADLVICQALLEHTRDNCAALRAIAGILKPGGKALVFAPSRNAAYARLNLVLPERLKCWVISKVYPEMSRDHGFPAHYDRSTPAHFTRLASELRLAVEDRRLYFHSVYFQFFLPLYVLWRLWILLFRRVAGSEAAETFAFVFRKDAEPPAPRILFGMNSLFAVRHLAGEMLGFVRSKGFEVMVAAPPDANAAHSIGEFEARFHAIALRREIAPLADMRALWQLWRLMRAIRPDVTDMSTPKMGLLGGLASWAARIPSRVYTLRGLRYETTRSWKRLVLIAAEKLACACAHQVIAISQSVRARAIEDGLASPEKIITLGERVSEGIPVRAALPRLQNTAAAALRRSLGIPNGVRVAGFIGRITRDKGVGELIECMRILEREGRDVHLLIAGEFERGDPVDAATEDWIRFHPRSHWTGYVPDPHLLYDVMDVFVFPTHREGLGKVLLEAAAAGKPVVSTRTTGVIDAVEDGVTGLLVPPGDARALARATATLLDDPERAFRMGAAGRKLIEEHYDNTVYLERMSAVLESLVRRPRAALEACPEIRG